MSEIFSVNNLEDEIDYHNALFKFKHGYSIFSRMLKNKLQLVTSKKFGLHDTDIDVNKFFNDSRTWLKDRYYLVDKFSDAINDSKMITNYSVIYINDQSLNNKMYNLSTYLNTLNHQFSIIAVKETYGMNLIRSFSYRWVKYNPKINPTVEEMAFYFTLNNQ